MNFSTKVLISELEWQRLYLLGWWRTQLLLFLAPFQLLLSGRKKEDKAKVFGELREQNLWEIWNGPEFLTFRQEVLHHQYPFCTNCNLVPCEYHYAEEFVLDCYVNKVPCGDCFWCMGLFNCLQ